MRGARCSGRSEAGEGGPIPRGAGSTSAVTTGTRPTAAHPRERGEHHGVVVGRCRKCGSSPRARGALQIDGGSGKGARLIPASAGSTGSKLPSSPCETVHPRERREHLNRPGAPREQRGSSPRARGARGRDLPAARSGGLIPAGAGSTTAPSTRATSGWAHPRERGEHLVGCRVSDGYLGSSPRARGTRVRPGRAQGPGGLIPASAGSTSPPPAPSPRRWAHPRERGEHAGAAPDRGWHHGSSPRARGAPLPAGDQDRDGRLIPASAGSTRCW